MKPVAYVALLAGIATAVALVAWQGVAALSASLGALGAGILLLPVVYAPHLAAAAVSWRQLFPPDREPRYLAALRAMWVGLSTEALLPAASMGSEIVKARLIMRAGASGSDAVGSVVADKTVQSIVLTAWGFVGVAVLATSRSGSPLLPVALIGAGALGVTVVGFVAAQHAGMFGFLAQSIGRAVRVANRPGMIAGANDLDGTLRDTYRRRLRVTRACLIRFCSRSLLLVELWLAAYLMGHVLTPWDAVMLGSLVGALRGAAFIVPSGWGVQEGGFVVLGTLIGVPAHIMLAVALAIRARELMVSLPGLALWQVIEGGAFRRWLARRRS